MSGRVIKITDGGSLVFHEDNDTGNFKATIIVSDLTADRTILIPDQDCTLGGLAPGEVWNVSVGGTGLGEVPLNKILAGSGTDSLKLIDAPTTHDTFLGWDDVTKVFAWAPIVIGLEEAIAVTEAINLQSNKPGVFSSKLGSQLRFKNIVGSSGVIVTDEINQLNVSFDISQTQGVVGVANGGTGLSTIGENQLIAGNSSNGFNVVAAPTGGNQYLRSNATNTGFEWVPINLVENFSGEMLYPANRVYTLSVSWPYPATIDNLTLRTQSGTLTCQVMKDNDTVGSLINVTTTKATTNFTGATLEAGKELRLLVSGVTNVQSLVFAFKLTRQ